MLVCSFYCSLNTSSFLSLTKYALYKHFHAIKPHLICECVFWNVFTIIYSCFECQVTTGKFGKECVCVNACVTAHEVIKEDCCYLAGSMFRHCEEGSWHQEQKQWTCALYNGTCPSVQARRQMWKFLIQLCSDNALDMFSKKNEGQIQWSAHVTHQHWWVWSTSVINTLLPVTLLLLLLIVLTKWLNSPVTIPCLQKIWTSK